MKFIECNLCHLDSPIEDTEDGMCYMCIDALSREDRFCTDFQKAHGHDYDRSIDDGN